VGRIGIGRVFSGTIHSGEKILVVKNDGSRTMAQVKQLFTFDYLGRKECDEVEAGDIAAVVGVDGTDIGDVYTNPDDPVELEPIEIDPPTLSIVFEASTSPLVGRDGDIVGGRQLKERLMQERENNVTMRIEELPDKTGIEVAGRGILHLSVLMEAMRREGYEFQVGRPRVLFKKGEGGVRLEPVEQAVVECPNEYSGKVIETFGNVGGTMVSMETGETQTHLEFNIPTRGIMGLKTRIMNVTHGEGVFYHTFLEYGPFAGDIGGRKNGAMISMSTEKAVAYALGTLQERGTLFVGPGDECYEGMLVGERPRPDDMVVNIAKTKQLGNQRSSTADIAVQLTPPRVFTLEEALEYIMDDELVEITPKNIRMRKRILNETDRRKWAVRHGLVKK
jgi:GTP-binding protein